MPLDARKAQHLLQVVTRSYAGRQRTVVAVTLANGSYSYIPLQVILRPQQVPDPQVYDVSTLSVPRTIDMVMIAPTTTNFTGVVYVADTVTATSSAVASAPKYEVVEVLPVGLLPGGSHLRVLLRRLR